MTQVSSLYLHVPFCRHLCNYCDFYKRAFDAPQKQIEEFHQFLRTSWIEHNALMAEQEVNWVPLETIYLGGGTPSLWGEAGAQFFSELALPQATQCEFTMEVDPGTWTPVMIESWKELGLNRLSIGTQSLDPVFLKIMDRVHSLEETHELLAFCQQGQWNFSLDFLLGVPYSRVKKRDIQNELDQLLQYEPRHISLYILNARSKYPHIQHMPDDEYIREEYLLVSSYLKSRGFHHYEVSNFALPGFESRHNQKYWEGESVAALGPTGTGYFAQAQREALRYKWKVQSAHFEREFLGQSELELEETYLSLRTSRGWKPRQMTDQLREVFTRWQQQQFGSFDGQKMVLSSLGFLMLDSLMNDLFKL